MTSCLAHVYMGWPVGAMHGVGVPEMVQDSAVSAPARYDQSVNRWRRAERGGTAYHQLLSEVNLPETHRGGHCISFKIYRKMFIVGSKSIIEDVHAYYYIYLHHYYYHHHNHHQQRSSSNS